MSREEFINKQWKRYPRLQREKRSFSFGRVQEVTSTHVELANRKTITQYHGSDVEREDIDFGKSISSTLLREGDVVAFDNVEKVFYLLSPCNKKCNIKLESQVRGWNEFLKKVERFFVKEEFFQARTPLLVDSPGVDHHIHYLEVVGIETKRRWCLPTSPEIHLKKLLCSGFDNIFEIKSCFRDDLDGKHHKAEFTMVEWYRSFVSLRELVKDLESLISEVSNKNIIIKEVKLKDRFFEKTGFHLTPTSSRDELLDLAGRLEVECSGSDDWNDIFFRIYMEKIEPTLGLGEPEVVFDFPPQQASLAQINADGWAERFELYWNGVELGNAYSEVNDPEENQLRFENEGELRRRSGFGKAPHDLEFFESLKMGMPPSCGIALGLDRLYMLLEGNESI